MRPRVPFEQNVTINPHNAELWRKYIKLEQRHGDASRVSSLYERALAIFCLLPDLWLEYASYTTQTLHQPARAVGILERAVRNVAHAEQVGVHLASI